MQTNLRLPSYYERRRLKVEKAITPVEFLPVRRNPLVPQSKIKVTVSIHGKFKNGKKFNMDPDGGKANNGEYWVDAAKADEFIIKGYALGELSRNYTEGERAQIRSTVQVLAPKGA
jgi:hypothetical protein